MSETDPSSIAHSVEKAHIWLNDVAEALGDGDRQYAYRALRAVLHALRDRLTVDMAANLASQPPMLIRGIYYEDWDPSGTPVGIHDVHASLDYVAAEGHMLGRPRLPPPSVPSHGYCGRMYRPARSTT